MLIIAASVAGAVTAVNTWRAVQGIKALSLVSAKHILQSQVQESLNQVQKWLNNFKPVEANIPSQWCMYKCLRIQVP